MTAWWAASSISTGCTTQSTETTPQSEHTQLSAPLSPAAKIPFPAASASALGLAQVAVRRPL
jgi:hypothetical protein